MRIAVTGSIATDHLMRFQGRFVDQLLPNELDHVSLSFLVDDLQVRRGGVASNIAFGLGQLGLRPLLIGAVGHDFEEHDKRLRQHGVDTHALHTSRAQRTARFLCTTDDDGNQIASFFPGAMSEASVIDLGTVSQRVGGLDLVLVGANDPEAMLRYTRDCRTAGLPFAADPSQQLARLQTDAIRDLVTGAQYLFTNEYEGALLLRKTGWTTDEVLARVSTWITTLGRKGCRIQQQGKRAIEVPAVPVTEAEDPTGVGDGFRAGFLAALAWGLTSTRAAQFGCVVAVEVLLAPGPQEYLLNREALVSLCHSAYGPETASDLSRHFSLAVTTGLVGG